jgi:GntR family transcriptional repressor for pyruvate dehydrogenase complex
VARALFGLLRSGVFYNRDHLYSRRGIRDMLLEHHRRIYQAIVDSSPFEAKEAAEAHLAFVHESITELSRQDRRREVGMLRLEKAIKAAPAAAKPRRRKPRDTAPPQDDADS